MSSPNNQPTERQAAAQSIVTRNELDVNALSWHEAGVADYAYQLHSHSGNLTVTVLNYGERQPGAEDVHLRLSRPVDGRDSFATTNGIAFFSADGKHLLLHDLFRLVVIATQSMKVYHYQLPYRTLFLGIGWDGAHVVGKTLGYGKRASQAEAFGPWTWQAIEKAWQPGIGSRLWEM